MEHPTRKPSKRDLPENVQSRVEKVFLTIIKKKLIAQIPDALTRDFMTLPTYDFPFEGF